MTSFNLCSSGGRKNGGRQEEATALTWSSRLGTERQSLCSTAWIYHRQGQLEIAGQEASQWQLRRGTPAYCLCCVCVLEGALPQTYNYFDAQIHLTIPLRHLLSVLQPSSLWHRNRNGTAQDLERRMDSTNASTSGRLPSPIPADSPTSLQAQWQGLAQGRILSVSSVQHLRDH